MKAFLAVAAAGLTAWASMGSVLAQPYGGSEYGYRERGPDSGYRERGPGYRQGGYGFDEREDALGNPNHAEEHQERAERV
jgi:hypothetical protein